MDYEKEASELRESNWLKLDEGKHTLVCLSDLSEPKTETKTIKGEQKTLTQSILRVEYEGKQYQWSVTKAPTPSSTWGQLVRLGKAWGSLVGKPLTVMIKGTGQNRDYTIQEALELHKQEQLI